MGDFVISQVADMALIMAAVFILLLLVLLFVQLSRVRKKLNNIELEKALLDEKLHKMEDICETTDIKNSELITLAEKLSKSNEYLKKMAYTDYLTELPNRIAFIEIADNVMLTLRSEEIIAFMDIDIDNFKYINDTLGHAYGDELLIDATYRLKQAMDENDYLARIGGAEFILMIQNMEDSSFLEDKIKKIRNVFSYPFVLSTKECFVTVSIGIALAPKDGKTSHTLIKNVYSALHVAKANGKNTYTYFDDSFNQISAERIEMQSELRKALEKNEFVLHYQPLIDLTLKKTIGFEALLRWDHPEKGLLYPDDFIYYAEKNGLIVPIGKWVLKTACMQLKQLEDNGYPQLHMAVNISARQFEDKDIIQTVYDSVTESGINPGKLELEITEKIAFKNFKYTLKILEELKHIGVIISLDNFGTGSLALSYLKNLPVSNLKIDKTILDAAVVDIKDQKVFETIVSIAKSFNLNVIAEGVENDDQEMFIIKESCNQAQGFLYSKPLPADEAIQFLNGKDKGTFINDSDE
jgi:diguanylate cyclase (GGDEF)-like protein